MTVIRAVLPLPWQPKRPRLRAHRPRYSSLPQASGAPHRHRTANHPPYGRHGGNQDADGGMRAVVACRRWKGAQCRRWTRTLFASGVLEAARAPSMCGVTAGIASAALLALSLSTTQLQTQPNPFNMSSYPYPRCVLPRCARRALLRPGDCPAPARRRGGQRPRRRCSAGASPASRLPGKPPPWRHRGAARQGACVCLPGRARQLPRGRHAAVGPPAEDAASRWCRPHVAGLLAPPRRHFGAPVRATPVAPDAAASATP